MEIILAKTAGFCFGVKRALELVDQALADTGTPIYSLGPLIHNPAVVAELETRGLKPVETLRGIGAGRVVIRSHGVGPSVIAMAQAQQLTLIDATCPFVKNVQELALTLDREGYQVVIVGEREHAEVKGVLDAVKGAAIVIEDPDEVDRELVAPKVGIVSQTTQESAAFNRVVGAIVPYAKECRIFNTICLATARRQQEAAELSRQVERMIVVGGKNSANTRHLAQICRSGGTLTYQVEDAAELQTGWFAGVSRIGVTAGASTPDAQIFSVVEKINLLGGNDVVSENSAKPNEPVEIEAELTEESFNYDWPEDRFQELVPGQIIEAKVILVRDDAAFVDIGGKSDLTIPLAELAAEPGESAKQLVEVGDVIKVVVTKTGDEEKIRLSKRLYDLEKIWLDLAEVQKQGGVVEGTVTAMVKGGLSVMVKGVRAFMPASQSGLGQVNLKALVGSTFNVNVLELDQAKHRLLVTRRALLEAQRKQAEAEFFSRVTEGERQTGVVTRLTDFGAFIDLGGGVEGLLHVSEISWRRVKSPRDLLKEGDTVEVLIIKADPETRRISLSLKQIQAHPWDEAAQKFAEGQVCPGTVVKLESFGAFVNLAPSLDGLVHISQIADKRIAKPDEVLKVGDQVTVKIIKIDTANRKISLSMKQVVQDQSEQQVTQFIEGQDAAPVSQSLGDLLKDEKELDEK
ncbi:MAG: bifunctional 4-hydroxy-3-methylbut-2-enyl diphosphate reductase/30S ribosomal protein S1 [Bacillota bacterium]|jgi:4-hydroxy-3-methylbut-2-enyl diphosphate reductase